MKKKRSKVILSLFIIVCLLFSFSGCFLIDRRSEEEIARDRIARLAQIEVPMEAEIVYHFREKDEFLTGRKPQYTVFQFESEPTDWLNENSFLQGRIYDFEKYFSLSAIPSAVLKEISEKFLPNFENSHYSLLTEDFVYFFYSEQDLLLMVLIYGH